MSAGPGVGLEALLGPVGDAVHPPPALTSCPTCAVTAQTMFSYLYSSIALYQYDTILTVGQVNVYPGANICSGNTTASVQGKVPVPCIRPSMLPRAVNATVPAVNGTVPVLTGR